MHEPQKETQSAPVPGTGGIGTPIGDLLKKIREPEPWTDAERQAVLDDLFFEGPEWIPYLKRFFTLIVLSTGIAAFGLVADSAAVVIGAMLVAPLMTPILATSTAVLYGRADRIAASLAVVAVGTAAAVGIGAVVASLTSRATSAADLPGEVLARTNPSLLDLGIAVTAGLAAGYVLSHRKAGSSLPGVAIAVALVPPLATVGIAWRLGATEEAQGALLLYLTNLVAIVLSAGAVMVASGFVPRHVRGLARGHVTAGFAISLVALLAISIPLALHTVSKVRDEQLTRLVVSAVPRWDELATIETIGVTSGDSAAVIELEIATTGDPQPAWELVELVAAETSQPIDLSVKYQLESTDAASGR